MNPEQWEHLTKTVDLFDTIDVKHGGIQTPLIDLVYEQTQYGYKMEVTHREPTEAELGDS